MSLIEVAQQAYDKVKTVTVAKRHGEIDEAFGKAGFKVSANKVLTAPDEAAFKALGVELKSVLPVALLSLRRICGKAGIKI